MFADIVGYTALTQRDEGAASLARRRHREALDRCLNDHDGALIQYFGDGSLSVFPSAVEGVLAAVEFQQDLQRDPVVQVRVGLHVGDITYDEQGAYGDAVNVAARIEGVAVAGSVLVSERVAAELTSHPKLSARPLGPFDFKNVREPVSVFAIEASGLTVPGSESPLGQSRPGPVGGATGSAAAVSRHLEELQKRSIQRPRLPGALPRIPPLIGRSSELTVLRQHLEAGSAGLGGTVFISGDRGVGKSRLAETIADEARGRGWLVTLGRVFAAERLVPFSPFSEAMLPILRGLDDDAITWLSGGAPASLGPIFPSLRRGGDGRAPRFSTPADLKAQVFFDFTEFLGRLAAFQPLLLVIDDLQWADESSIELLHFVARQCTGHPIVILCQYSQADLESSPGVGTVVRSLVEIGAATELNVASLSAENTEEVVRSTFDVADGNDEHVSRFCEMLFRWTGGNPFFLESTLSELVETGRLTATDGVWSGWKDGDFELPRSVRAAVMARADRLSPDARRLAELASIVGTHMSHEVLSLVSGLSHSEFADALDELLRHHLLVESQRGQSILYDFRHPMIGETLQAAQSLTHRRVQHGLIAEALERHYGENEPAVAGELAYHYQRAAPRAPGHATRYLVLAGSEALSRHANQEASAYFKEALTLIDEGGPRSSSPSDAAVAADPDLVVRSLAKAKSRLGDYDESIHWWKKAAATATATGDRPGLVEIHRQVGLALLWADRIEEAAEEFAAGLEIARELGDDLMVGRLTLSACRCFQNAGLGKEAKAAAEEAVEIATRRNDDRLLALAHTSLTQLHTWNGELDLVRVHGERALELADRCGDREVAFWGHWALAVMEGVRGNTAEMAVHIQGSRDVARELGSPLMRLMTAELQMEFYHASGDWDAGIALGEEAVSLARSLNLRTLVPRLLVTLSSFYLGRGQLELANDLTEEAWETSGSARADADAGFIDVHTVVPAHIGRAAYHLAAGDWYEAIRVGEAARALTDRSGYVVWGIHRLLPLIGEAHFRTGNLKKAAEVAGQLRRQAESMGHGLGLAWADAGEALAIWLAGDSEEGAERLKAAADALDQIPMVFDAARLRRQLAGRLAETGKRDDAVRELTAAYRTFARVGAADELERARGQFRELMADPPE